MLYYNAQLNPNYQITLPLQAVKFERNRASEQERERERERRERVPIKVQKQSRLFAAIGRVPGYLM